MKPNEPSVRTVNDAMSDESLMDLFCHGSTNAFDMLFSRHARPVQRYLTRITGNASLADDLTQSTFLSLVKARGRFMAGSKLKPWLYAIATNAARDAHRRGLHESLSDDGNLPEQAVDDVHVDKGLQKQVQNALNQLPLAQREAIVMHRFEGLSFAEIADVAQVTESAVKVRAHRGYQMLRDLLHGVWNP